MERRDSPCSWVVGYRTLARWPPEIDEGKWTLEYGDTRPGKATERTETMPMRATCEPTAAGASDLDSAFWLMMLPMVCP